MAIDIQGHLTLSTLMGRMEDYLHGQSVNRLEAREIFVTCFLLRKSTYPDDFTDPFKALITENQSKAHGQEAEAWLTKAIDILP